MGYNDYKAAEKERQVVRKHKTKIYTEACYFPLKIGRGLY